MSEFPTLTQMGIKHPNQIARYTLYEWNQTDHLRVIYDRQKGSLLPESRKYKFPQQRKSVLVNSGTRQMQTLYESHPVLAAAVQELDRIVDRKHTIEGRKAVLMEEVEHLEQEMHERIACIKAMVDDLK